MPAAVSRLTTAIAICFVTYVSSAQGENLLRNGSFEGGLLYWHNVNPEKHKLVRGDAKVGEYALRINESYVASAPFVARRGEPMTVSFFVRGDKPGTVGVSMPPSAREVGTRAKRLWMREGTQTAPITTEWKRVSFTWPGGAKTFKLAVLKKDTQRAAEVKSFKLNRDGTPVSVDFEVELTRGHELVFLPLIPDWNNATATTLENLEIQQVE